MLYGDERRERNGAGRGDGDRRRHPFGQLAGRVSEQDKLQNAFQKGISRVSMLLDPLYAGHGAGSTGLLMVTRKATAGSGAIYLGRGRLTRKCCR